MGGELNDLWWVGGVLHALTSRPVCISSSVNISGVSTIANIDVSHAVLIGQRLLLANLWYTTHFASYKI